MPRKKARKSGTLCNRYMTTTEILIKLEPLPSPLWLPAVILQYTICMWHLLMTTYALQVSCPVLLLPQLHFQFRDPPIKVTTKQCVTRQSSEKQLQISCSVTTSSSLCRQHVKPRTRHKTRAYIMALWRAHPVPGSTFIIIIIICPIDFIIIAIAAYFACLSAAFLDTATTTTTTTTCWNFIMCVIYK